MAEGRIRALMATLAVDVRPLRHSSGFRRIWTGQLISMMGRQVTTVAVPYQVYTTTHSPVLVGLIGIFQVVPLITVSLLAGSVSDRFDRRKVLLATQVALTLCSSGLFLGALTGHAPLLLLYALVFVAAGVGALDSPTRTALVVNLVDREHLAGALSLNFGIFQVALVVGPSVGGLAIDHLGLAGAYALDVVSFMAALVSVALLPPQRPASTAVERPIAALRRGWAFLRTTPAVLGGYAMDLGAMIFGMPRSLFPVLAATRFHVNASGLGLLYAAVGVGGVLAIALAGWAGRARRQGRIVVASIVVWGLAIILFGLTTTFWLGLLFLVAAGAADAISGVCRNTMMQTLTPDELRGRLTAVYMMVVGGGPYIGDAEAGAVASAFNSAEFSVISGGALCIVGLGLACLAFPAVWNYGQSSGED